MQLALNQSLKLSKDLNVPIILSLGEDILTAKIHYQIIDPSNESLVPFGERSFVACEQVWWYEVGSTDSVIFINTDGEFQLYAIDRF